MSLFAPYGIQADGSFDCGASDGGYTGTPSSVTCEGCKAKSPGLWPAMNCPDFDHMHPVTLAAEATSLWHERERLSAAIRKHRDYRGDDRCFQDDAELYSVLPEGDTRPARETAVTLENCKAYIECRQTGREYVSPQRKIEEQDAELATLRLAMKAVEAGLVPVEDEPRMNWLVWFGLSSYVKGDTAAEALAAAAVEMEAKE